MAKEKRNKKGFKFSMNLSEEFVSSLVDRVIDIMERQDNLLSRLNEKEEESDHQKEKILALEKKLKSVESDLYLEREKVERLQLRLQNRSTDAE